MPIIISNTSTVQLDQDQRITIGNVKSDFYTTTTTTSTTTTTTSTTTTTTTSTTTTSTSTTTTPVPPVTSGLTLWYKATGYTSGSQTWTDSSTTGNTGTFIGTPAIYGSNPDRLSFSNFFQNQATTTNVMVLNSNTWTISAWFRTLNPAGPKTVGM